MRSAHFTVVTSILLVGMASASAGEFGRRSVVIEGSGYYGAPAGYVATVSCQYPDGWNAGDAARELRGVPNGVNHRCRVNGAGTVIDSDGQPTE